MTNHNSPQPTEQPEGEIKWAEDEEKMLNGIGYSTLGHTAWKKNNHNIEKRFNGYSFSYWVGVEGTAQDVDGDWGWCRSWHIHKSLLEAIIEHRLIPATEVPRRARMDLFSNAEVAITNAMVEVEKAGAHPHLTKAVILLSDARNAVADFVDKIPEPLPSPQPESVDALGEEALEVFETKLKMYAEDLFNEFYTDTQIASGTRLRTILARFVDKATTLAGASWRQVDAEPSPQEELWEDLVEDFALMNRLGVYDQMELLKKMKSKYQLFKSNK